MCIFFSLHSSLPFFFLKVECIGFITFSLTLFAIKIIFHESLSSHGIVPMLLEEVNSMIPCNVDTFTEGISWEGDLQQQSSV